MKGQVWPQAILATQKQTEFHIHIKKHFSLPLELSKATFETELRTIMNTSNCFQHYYWIHSETTHSKPASLQDCRSTRSEPGREMVKTKCQRMWHYWVHTHGHHSFTPFLPFPHSVTSTHQHVQCHSALALGVSGACNNATPHSTSHGHAWIPPPPWLCGH